MKLPACGPTSHTGQSPRRSTECGPVRRRRGRTRVAGRLEVRHSDRVERVTARLGHSWNEPVATLRFRCAGETDATSASPPEPRSLRTHHGQAARPRRARHEPGLPLPGLTLRDRLRRTHRRRAAAQPSDLPRPICRGIDPRIVVSEDRSQHRAVRREAPILDTTGYQVLPLATPPSRSWRDVGYLASRSLDEDRRPAEPRSRATPERLDT